VTDSLDARLKDLVDDFAVFDDWEDRYRYIIDLGKDLVPLSDLEKNDDTKVLGCASQVWLVLDKGDAQTLHFRGDSDAFIVRGLIALLVRLLDGLPKPDVARFDIAATLSRLGLSEALSSQRTNGLRSMVNRLLRASGA
jgi:cysteine desulfuration protein SufE